MTMSAPSSPHTKVPTPTPSQKEVASKKEESPSSPEAKQSSTTSPSTGGRASSRNKTQVQRLTNSPVKKAQDNDDAFAEAQLGPSEPLADYDSIARNLDKFTADDVILVELHRSIYGVPGKKIGRKGRIRAWQGCPAGDEKAKEVRIGIGK